MSRWSLYPSRSLFSSQALSSSSTQVATPLPYTFQQVVTEGTDTIINLLHYLGVRVRWASLKGENPELAEHLFEVEEETYLQRLTIHWTVGHAWRVDPYRSPARSPVQSTRARREHLELEALMQDTLEDETWRPTFPAAEWSP